MVGEGGRVEEVDGDHLGVGVDDDAREGVVAGVGDQAGAERGGCPCLRADRLDDVVVRASGRKRGVDAQALVGALDLGASSVGFEVREGVEEGRVDRRRSASMRALSAMFRSEVWEKLGERGGLPRG
jgi:hypothetical protein